MNFYGWVYFLGAYIIVLFFICKLMRTFIVLALVFAAANSSFLRELEATKISTIEFTDACVDISATTTAAATVTTATEVTGTFKATLSFGEKTIETTAEEVTAGTSISFATINLTSKHTGVYKFTKVEDTATGAEAATFTLPETNTATLTLSLTGALGEQVADQEVIDGDSTKNSFKIVFTDETFVTATGGPVIYADSEGKKPIADCSVLEANTKEVVCKPTKEEMGKSGEFTIYYQNGCGDNTIVTTEAKIKYTAKEDSSVFMNLGKVAMIALALLF